MSPSKAFCPSSLQAAALSQRQLTLHSSPVRTRQPQNKVAVASLTPAPPPALLATS